MEMSVDAYYRDEIGVWDWYVSGEFVLDRLLGVRRADRLLVHCPGATPPSPAAVRTAFNLPPIVGIEITDAAPRVIIALDSLVLLPSGTFFDLLAETAIPAPKELRMDLTEYDLTAVDILRLARLSEGYEEVYVDPLLAARLRADIEHLQSIRDRFPGLEVEFMNVVPLAAWRVRRGQR